MRAAIMPPAQSPKNRSQVYLPPSRRINTSGHDLDERSFELAHFLLCTDADADVSGPNRPDAANVDMFCRHLFDDLPARLFHVDHELIRHRGYYREALRGEEAQGIFAHAANDLTALGNESLDLKAGAGAGHTGDRHHARAPSAHLLDEVRTAYGRAGAQSRHTVDLGEGAQHDHVLVLGHQVGIEVVVARDVRVSFVDQHYRALGFVLDQPLDIRLRRQRACRIVGIADVNQSALGAGRDHGLYVVREVLFERNLDD